MGIDENTAILVDGDTFEVLGTGVATVADGENDAYTAAADLLLSGAQPDRAAIPAPAEMTPGWHASHTPDRPAVVMGSTGTVVTYRELEERSTRFARALRSRVVREPTYAK